MNVPVTFWRAPWQASPLSRSGEAGVKSSSKRSSGDVRDARELVADAMPSGWKHVDLAEQRQR